MNIFSQNHDQNNFNIYLELFSFYTSLSVAALVGGKYLKT